MQALAGDGPQLKELVRYPLKSGIGERLEDAGVERRGLVGDRRWMVVDSKGVFLTAREHPRLLLVRAAPGDFGALTLFVDGRSPCVVDAPLPQRTSVSVSVWADDCAAFCLGDVVARWMTEHLGLECRVVYMPDTVERAPSGDVARRGDLVSFADGYPLLLAQQESLNQLNSQLSPKVPMACFRPNLVVAGFEPFAELTWSRLRIGALEFEVGGPCVRCQLTTRDPKTGERRRDGEPLAALAKDHRSEGGVVFGINLIPRSVGRLSVGDPVEILATH
jgi:uncharacterized protein YcbX